MNNKKIAILAVFVAFAVLLTPAAFSDSDSNTPLENTDAYSAPVLGSSSSEQIEINDLSTLVSKAAEANAQLILVNDISIESLKAPVSFADGVILDLNGHSITIPDISEANHNRLVVSDGVTVKIKDSTGIGSIVYENSDNSNLGKSPLKIGGGETADAASTLTLENVNILSNEYGVGVFDYGTLNVTGGSIIAEYSAISGNGITSSSTSITLTEGYYESKTAAAVYLSANGDNNTYKINGGEFVGLTGFDIRAGTVEIDDAKITATGKASLSFPASDGPSGWGMGIAVFDHVSYGDSISVTIKNVEFDCNTYDIYVGQHPGSGASGSDVSFGTVAPADLHDDISVVLDGQFKYTSSPSTEKSALFADRTVNGFEILDKTLIGGNAELTITGNAFVSDGVKIVNNGTLSVEGTLTGKIAAGANNIGCSASNGTIAGTVTLSPGAALQYLNIDGNVVIDGNGETDKTTTIQNNNITSSGIAVSYTGIDAGTVDVTANYIKMSKGNTNAAMNFEGVRSTPSDNNTFIVNITGNKVVSDSGRAVSGNDKYYSANGGSIFNIKGNDFSETVAQQGGIIFIRSLDYDSKLTVEDNLFPSEWTNVSLSGSNGILFNADKISYLDGLEISEVSSVSIANGSQAAVHGTWTLPSDVTLILEGRSSDTSYDNQSPGLTIENGATFNVDGNIFINNENVTTAAVITNNGTLNHENAVIMVNDGKSLESALLLGGNIQLAGDITYTTTTNSDKSAAFTVSKDTVLDLNGKTLTSGNVIVFKIIESELTVCDSSSEPGFIISSYSSVNSYSAVQVGAPNDVSGNLLLKDGVHVKGNGYGIYCMTGSSVEIDDAAIVTGLSAVSGNGQNNNSIVKIHGGSFTSTTSAAVFFPSTDSLTVTGGEFFGKTGFDIRAGTVSIENVEITLDQNGTIDQTGNVGPSSWGMGIAIIDNGNYASGSEIKVTIKDVDVIPYRADDNEGQTESTAKYYDIYVGDLNLGENGAFKAEFGETYKAKHNVTLTINTLVFDKDKQPFTYQTTAGSQAGRLAVDCFGLEISENFVLTEDSTLASSTLFGIIREVTVEGSDRDTVLAKLAEIETAMLVKSAESQLDGKILLKIGNSEPIDFLSTYGMTISSDECILGLAPNENGGISFGLIRGEITVGKSSVGSEDYNIFISHNDSMEILPDAKLIIGKDYTGTVHTSGKLIIYEGGILEVADGKTFSTITGSVSAGFKYGNVTLIEGAQIVLGAKSSIEGAIYSHDESSVSDIKAGESGLTITGGSLIIDGDLEKITINEGVDENDNPVTSNVIINNFDDSKTTVTYKNKDGNKVTDANEIAKIANITYTGKTVKDGVTIESKDLEYNGSQQVNFSVDTPAGGSKTVLITSISYNGVVLTNPEESLTSNNAAGATATWNSTLGGFTGVNVKNAGTYTLHYEILPTTSGGTLSIDVSFEVTKKGIAPANTENITKEYNGNKEITNHNFTPEDGIVEGDAVTITAEYRSKYANTGIPLKFTLTGADAGNYTLAETNVTGSITKKELNIDNVSDITKVYDGTADIDLTGKIELTGGVIDGDDVSFTYESVAFGDKSADSDKTITIIDPSLSGNDARNYILADTLKKIKGSITPLELTIESTTQSISKEYNGDNTYDGNNLISTYYKTNVINGDNITIAFNNVTFDSKDVDATKILFTVELAGDDKNNYSVDNTGYTLNAKITPKDISTAVIGITSDNLTYNGKEQTVTFTVKDGEILTSNDWSIQNDSSKGTDAGRHTLTIAGENNYKGTATAEWEIAKYLITGKDIFVENTFYKDEGVTPTVKISANGMTFEESSKFAVVYMMEHGGQATTPLDLGIYKAIITSLTDEDLAKNYSVDIKSFKEFEVNSDVIVIFYSQDGTEELYQWTVEQYDEMHNHPEEYRTYLPLSEGKIFKGWAEEVGENVVYSSNQPIELDDSDGTVKLYAVFEDIEENEPSVSIDLPTNFVVGKEAVFSVSTTAGNKTGTMVKGVAELSGIESNNYTIWYLENNPDDPNHGNWLKLISDSFGPETGFPLADATSYFKIVFNKACVFNLKVSIVGAENSDAKIAETGATVIVLDKSVSSGPKIDDVYYQPELDELDGFLLLPEDYDVSNLHIFFSGPTFDIYNNGRDGYKIKIVENGEFIITSDNFQPLVHDGGIDVEQKVDTFLPGMYVIKLYTENAAGDLVLLDRYYLYLEEQKINIDFTGFEKNGEDANEIINSLLKPESGKEISDSAANTAYVIYTQSGLLSDNLVGYVRDSGNNLIYTEKLNNEPGRHVWYFTLTGKNSETGTLYNNDCAPGTYKVVIKSNENTVASDYFYVPDNRAAYILDVSHLPSENKVRMTLVLNGYTEANLDNFAIALSGPADIRDSSPLSYYVDSENENASYIEEGGSIIITMKMDAEMFVSGGYIFTLLMRYNDEYVVPVDRYYFDLDLQLPYVKVISSGYDENADTVKTNLVNALNISPDELSIADKTMYIVYDQFGYNYANMIGKLFIEGNDGEFTQQIGSWYGDNFEGLRSANGTCAWYFSFDENQPGNLSEHYTPGATYLLQIVASYENETESVEKVVCNYMIIIPAAEENYEVEYIFDSGLGTVSGSQLNGNIVAFTVTPNEGYAAKVTSNDAIIFSDGSSYIAILNNKSATISVEFKEIGTANRVTVEAEKCKIGVNTGLVAYLEAYNGLNLPEGTLTAYFSVMTLEKMNNADFCVLDSVTVSEDITSSSDTESGCPLIYVGTAKLLSGYASYEFERTDGITLAPQSSIIQF